MHHPVAATLAGLGSGSPGNRARARAHCADDTDASDSCGLSHIAAEIVSEYGMLPLPALEGPFRRDRIAPRHRVDAASRGLP